MSPVQAAHLRILETIPRERIRTHEWTPQSIRTSDWTPGSAAQKPETLERRATIARMLMEINPATGRRWSTRAIAAQMHISRVTVQNHVRALKNAGFTR